VLTLTAAVMSYPWANDLLYTLSGSEPPPRAQGGGPQAVQRHGGGEARESKPTASLDAFYARAEQQAPGWVMIMMRLAPSGDGPVTLLIQEPAAPHMFARSQLTLNRSTAEVVKWEPYAAASTGRKLRVWVRGLHTGEALGFVGQTVAGLASLGGCFLVWTGIAMAWRRFRYRKRDAEDASTVEYPSRSEEARPMEMPTKHSNIVEKSQEAARIDIEAASTTPMNGHALGGREEMPAQSSNAPHDGDSVLILYGTVTGTAETLAHKMAAELRSDGVITRVRDMAHCQPSVLTQANCVLLVVSTYGDGEPPDDAVHFWEAVVLGHGLDLRGVRYSVLALGNTTYDHFCKCGRDFDAALERHGAIRIYPRVDCDVDYKVPAKHWLDGVRVHLAIANSSALSA
jgi:sulfite reductase (NADPH) flavoprotein alpha-component